MPVRIRNGVNSALSPSITSSWASKRSRSRPWAMVNRAEWSVSTMYSWPRARAAAAMASMVAPPSLQVE